MAASPVKIHTIFTPIVPALDEFKLLPE